MVEGIKGKIVRCIAIIVCHLFTPMSKQERRAKRKDAKYRYEQALVPWQESGIPTHLLEPRTFIPA